MATSSACRALRNLLRERKEMSNAKVLLSFLNRRGSESGKSDNDPIADRGKSHTRRRCLTSRTEQT